MANESGRQPKTAKKKTRTDRRNWQNRSARTCRSHINRIETGKYNPSLDVVQKLADSIFDVTIDYLVSDTDEDFKELRIEDKNLMERIKLIEFLEEDDKTALIRVIDSMLTKKKIFNLITKENAAERRV
jgi:transcriptional regulator with XRE-family HTH domain